MLAVSAASAALIWASRVAASTSSPAAVYIHDPSAAFTQPSSRSTLDPLTAGCVLAQRANIPARRIASLDGCVTDETIRAINAYGVRTSLTDARDPLRATILLEGLEHDQVNLGAEHSRAFAIDPSPSRSDARHLIEISASQSGSLVVNAPENSKELQSPKRDAFYKVDSAEAYAELWNRLSREGMHLTTISLPLADGNTEAHWSVFKTLDGESATSHHGAHIDRRSNVGRTTAGVTSGSLRKRQGDSTYNGSLPGILPACFTSQSACESTTLNCTGHGSCVKKYSDASDPSSGSSVKTCFACQCRATTSENSRGQTKTTYWGGPACQKKDISSSFWLLALFTIAMIFLVGFAVGQIWGMGDEELPSVIGAGVSGPVRRS